MYRCLTTVTCLYELKMYEFVWDLYYILNTLFTYVLSTTYIYIGFWKEPDDGIDKPGI